MKEKRLKGRKGIPTLFLLLGLHLLSSLLFFTGVGIGNVFGGLLSFLAGIYFLGAFILYAGFKVIKPQEAAVYTLFGKYYGTLRETGFFYIHPFSSSFNPAARTKLGQSGDVTTKSLSKSEDKLDDQVVLIANNKISLKVMTLNNSRQKINDRLGNPVEIGIAVMWRVVDTARAVFEVDNYKEYLSLQCDSAVRDIARIYPYDVAEGIDTTGDGIADEGSLRGSSEVVANRIKEKIQEKVTLAGIEILDARITYLAYAPEIAAAMLQRQQAVAIVDARSTIVDGAVGMVEMALEKLRDKGVVDLDEEKKAAMVSNLMVVLCSNKDPQPTVNSGSIN